GVESVAEAELLTDLGCDELQGYYFSQPIPAEISTVMASARYVTGAAIPINASVGIVSPELTDDHPASILPRPVVAA
ncbi:MAG: EAL domain-containing protein, partial [Alphaproteobacteria bacterium]